MKKLLLLSCVALGMVPLLAQQTTINGPAGSGAFGTTVTALTNGNYVVTDPGFDEGATLNVGAVYLYNGSTHALISTLKGSTANDQVGLNGIITLSNGNYLVVSTNWQNGSAARAGAVTWCNATTGINGVVSSANSLVGSNTFDLVGVFGVIEVGNSNYVVASPFWRNGSASSAGAITWGNGTTGISGPVSSANSLVGTSTGDNVGFISLLTNGNYVVQSINWDNGSILNAGAATWGNGNTGITGPISSANSLVGNVSGDAVGALVTPLTNGNYVITSSLWDNGSTTNAGAVTWCNGSTGTTGVVSILNSLVGSTANDNIGSAGVTALSNGNYVIGSPNWDNTSGSPVVNAGAATLGNGSTGTVGVVGITNSLYGSQANDNVGSLVTALLTNGNYVVTSPQWDNGAFVDAGAATWGNGSSGITGPVSVSNSLVGDKAGDEIGSAGITPLTNGNYVVVSQNWDNGAATNAGAVTWGNGTTGESGPVSSSNSLVGSTASDQVGSGGVTALTNGNYVVVSQNWDNGAATDAGAATWGSGTTGVSGVISSSNSLVGSTASDQVGSGGVAALSNGNYVVASQNWDNGAATDAGAATWGSGTTGVSGVISSSNSLVGSTANDQVGSGVFPISNGNYVVTSSNWDNGAIVDVGAATWGSGTTGVSGVISSSNSLVGGTANDQVGNGGITALSTGGYVVRSTNWDNGATTNAGAVTLSPGSTGLSGTITTCNSVTGTVANGGATLVSSFNATFNYLIVGLRNENKVVIYNPTGQVLAIDLDIETTTISGTTATPLVTSPSCRIIATVTPNGSSPVSGAVTSRVWIQPTVLATPTPFVTRHYEITPAVNASSATAKVTLYFTQQEFTDFNNGPNNNIELPTGPSDASGKANLLVEQRGGTSSNGTGLPNTYTGTITNIDPDDDDIVWNASLNRWEVSFNVTGFSGFFVKTTPIVLPLQLLEFSGRMQGEAVHLDWKTTDEINTIKFIVERSTDGRQFSGIGSVAALNRPGVHQYAYQDSTAVSTGAKVLYYRLQQMDKGGQFTYSNVVSIPIDTKNKVSISPNPVRDQVTIICNLTSNEQLKVNIRDNTGRLIQQQNWSAISGKNVLNINLNHLANGWYYAEIVGTTTKESRAFIKQ